VAAIGLFLQKLSSAESRYSAFDSCWLSIAAFFISGTFSKGAFHSVLRSLATSRGLAQGDGP
jgi:hypothetical protein